jgi:hypothetical protein
MTKNYRKARSTRKIDLENRTDLAFRALVKSPFVKAAPNDPDRIRQRIKGAIRDAQPLDMIVFWGGSRQGRFKKAGEPENAALKLLEQVRGELRNKGVQTNVRLMLMDTYARNLNLRPENEIRAYERSMRALASRFGVEIARTSDHFGSYSPLPEYASTPSQRKWQREARAIRERLMKNVAARTALESLGSKHGKGPSADKYIEMHAYEDPRLERRYQRTVFLSFVHDEIQRAISGLPTVFLYRQKEPGKIGERGVPWFKEYGQPTVVKSEGDKTK